MPNAFVSICFLPEHDQTRADSISAVLIAGRSGSSAYVGAPPTSRADVRFMSLQDFVLAVCASPSDERSRPLEDAYMVIGGFDLSADFK